MLFTFTKPHRYADRAKQIVCKAVINEDPNAKVSFLKLKVNGRINARMKCLFTRLSW